MKALAPKTLEKMYADLGLSREKVDLLHTYYRCFANLYGVIFVKDAWNVFRHYEGFHVRKKDFVAFSGIVQREPGLPYSVFELKEIYRNETSIDPAERIIVDNRMLEYGYYRFINVYQTFKRQAGKPYFLPDDRASFVLHAEDQFFLTPEGQAIVRFLSKLKTRGSTKSRYNKPTGELKDMTGHPVAGKRLGEFICYTPYELFDIGDCKNEARKEKLRQKYRTTALNKALDMVFDSTQMGGFLGDATPVELFERVVAYMSEQLGVSLSPAQTEQFLQLFIELNNGSHLWRNAGWKPVDLMRSSMAGGPPAISFGPNMKKMFEEGLMDRTELEEGLRALGIKLVDEDE